MQRSVRDLFPDGGIDQLVAFDGHQALEGIADDRRFELSLAAADGDFGIRHAGSDQVFDLLGVHCDFPREEASIVLRRGDCRLSLVSFEEVLI